MNYRTLLVVFIIPISMSYVNSEDYCWATDPLRSQVYQSFDSKTAYQVIRGNAKDYSNISGCTAQKIWLVARHGTRLPGGSTIKKMAEMESMRDKIVQIYESASQSGNLCPQDVELIRNWKWNQNITEDLDEVLVDQGWDDLKWLAQSYRAAYPTLLNGEYLSEKYHFRFTNTQRTEASFKGFIDGLFGEEFHSNFTLPPIGNPDYLLKPYDNCPSWLEHDDIYSGPGTEPYLFRQSDPYNNVIQDVSKRLGLSEDALSETDVRTLADLCRYEQAYYINETSAWCAAFTPYHAEVFNFDADLKSYYKVGHGAQINNNLTCDIIQDLITRLNATTDEHTFYFTHSSTINLIFVALGLRVDESDLTADGFETQLNEREWRTTEIGPFTSNIAAVKYNCPTHLEPEKVLLLHNERPLEIDGCTNGLCDWLYFKNKYSHFGNGNCRDIFCPPL